LPQSISKLQKKGWGEENI